ncbi:glycogen debranching enzyme, partial [Vibrio parahaemolyticus]|nr:glycogen debranching enzyme [Vibrio parahaemolyticus]
MKMNLSTPFPLGATLDAEGCNFAIYAPANRDILLALFHADGSYETLQPEHEYAGVKHTHITGIHAGKKYGYLIELNVVLHYNS